MALLAATLQPATSRADAMVAASPAPPAEIASELAAAPAAAALPSAAELERLGATIGRILINSKDLFDLTKPGENNALFRLANRLHPVTRDRVIAKTLIVHPGDRFNRRRIAECERLLRAQRYLYDAEIVPVAWDGERVDLEVRTRDVWSLRVGASLRHAGEATTTHFELQDFNFLGFGKDIALSRDQDAERTSYVAGYRDRNLLGTHTRVELSYVDSSDGLLEAAIIDRPFFALDSHWAAGLSTRHEEKIDSLYRLNKRISRYAHDQDFFRIYGGFSRGLSGSHTLRYSLGYTLADDRFDQLPARRWVIPDDRRLAYPWASVALVVDRFETARDLDKIDRTEDLNLGLSARLQLGWSAPAFGADRKALIYEATASDGWRLRPGMLLLYDASASGRWDDLRHGRDVLLTAAGRFYWRDFGSHNLYIGLSGALAHYLDYDHQLMLGGDNGLRGYPQYYQDGNRRYLLTVEQRFYRAREYFHLVRFGAAVFFDVGRCWFIGETYRADLGILKDVGIGLRISSSRSATATMLHFDVAFPLDGSGDIKRAQWLVTTSETF